MLLCVGQWGSRGACRARDHVWDAPVGPDDGAEAAAMGSPGRSEKHQIRVFSPAYSATFETFQFHGTLRQRAARALYLLP